MKAEDSEMTIVQQYIGQQSSNWTRLLEFFGSLGDAGKCLRKRLEQQREQQIAGLDFRRMQIGNTGAELLGHTQCPSLVSAILWNNSIDSSGLTKLLKADWPNLRKLNLGANNIDCEGVRLLTRVNWPNLDYLYLTGSKIGDRGAQHLNHSNWPKLQVLALWSCQISQQGVKSLIKANWPKLKRFHINHNHLQNTGLTLILTLSTRIQLTSLYASQNNQINNTIQQHLEQAFAYNLQ